MIPVTLLVKVGEILFPIFLREFTKKHVRKIRRKFKRKHTTWLSDEDIAEIEAIEAELKKVDPDDK